MLAMDKSYYDYDFNEEAMQRARAKAEVKPKTSAQIKSMLERFGFKTKLRSDTEKKPCGIEEMQRVVMAETSNKH